MSTKRCAIYLRVSTDGQTTDNQLIDLRQAALARGWTITAAYSDAGISGSKGRDKRPGLDKMLTDAVKRKFDVLMVWAVDRLGRSLQDLVSTLADLQGARVDLFLHQQGVDTTTPGGKAMFQMLGVFSEFERSLIVARIHAGMARAKAEQAAGKERLGPDGLRKKRIGRPEMPAAERQRIRDAIATGLSVRTIAQKYQCSKSLVQQLKA